MVFFSSLAAAGVRRAAVLLITAWAPLVGRGNRVAAVAGPLTFLMMLDYVWNAWRRGPARRIAHLWPPVGRAETDQAIAFERWHPHTRAAGLPPGDAPCRTRVVAWAAYS